MRCTTKKSVGPVHNTQRSQHPTLSFGHNTQLLLLVTTPNFFINPNFEFGHNAQFGYNSNSKFDHNAQMITTPNDADAHIIIRLPTPLIKPCWPQLPT